MKQGKIRRSTLVDTGFGRGVGGAQPRRAPQEAGRALRVAAAS